MQQVARGVPDFKHTASPFKRMPCVFQAAAQRVEGFRIRQYDLEPTQSNGVLWRWWRASPGPGVDSQMVVIAACRKKGSTWAKPHHKVKTDGIPVEPLGFFNLRNVQMHVTDTCSGVQARPCRRILAQFGDDTVDIQRCIVHPDGTVQRARPIISCTVTIDLDPISVRIRKIDRLADQMVGKSLHRRAAFCNSMERSGEVEARWHKDRKMVEAGRPIWMNRTRHLVQLQKVPIGHTKHGPPFLPFIHTEAQSFGIKIDASIQVCDRQRDFPNSGFIR